MAAYEYDTGKAEYFDAPITPLLSFLHSNYQDAAVFYASLRELGFQLKTAQVPEIRLVALPREAGSDAGLLQNFSPKEGHIRIALNRLRDRFSEITDTGQEEYVRQRKFHLLNQELSQYFLHFLVAANRQNIWLDSKTHAFGFETYHFSNVQEKSLAPHRGISPVTIEFQLTPDAFSASPKFERSLDYAGLFMFEHLLESVRWEGQSGDIIRNEQLKRVSEGRSNFSEEDIRNAIIPAPLLLLLLPNQLAHASRELDVPLAPLIQITQPYSTMRQCSFNTVILAAGEAYAELTDRQSILQDTRGISHNILGIINLFNPSFFKGVEQRVLTNAEPLGIQARTIFERLRNHKPRALWARTIQYIDQYEEACSISEDAARHARLRFRLSMQSHEVVRLLFGAEKRK